MQESKQSIDNLCVNTIRTLSIDMVERAKSGHPGLPLGAAPMAYTLFSRHLKFNSQDPEWSDRDRFVLSAGHGSALLYSLLHLCGYELSMDEIKSFRQLNSITPGHPEAHLTPGVEATTGPLGQGDANAVGMAIAERALANLFNKPGFEIVNHYTYALTSDGGLMEGVSKEAVSLAGHLKLGKLIVLYDANDISLDGPISLSFDTEDVAKRYESYGWQVLHVSDGDTDLDSIDNAITKAKSETGKPSLIIIKTTIGYGSPNKANDSKVHGSPLGDGEIQATKVALGWDPDKEFYVPNEVAEHFAKIIENGKKHYDEWNSRFEKYEEKYPELAMQYRRVIRGNIPENWDSGLSEYEPGKSTATRHASHATLNIISKNIPEMLVGAADVAASTLARLDEDSAFEGQHGTGRNIYFGVREHAMGAIANGIAWHKGLIPIISTYFVFTDYLRPAIRLAAMNELPVVYVCTHDSIAVGEDGPTHQPVEHLMSLRAIPGLIVMRPADTTETLEAWRWIMANRNQPVMLVLTRQNLPIIDRNKFAPADGLHKGAYILSDSSIGNPQVTIIATGSEVHLALDVMNILEKEGIGTKVVSMPSWEIFSRQPQEYKDSVILKDRGLRVSIEAGFTQGWEKWIGCDGLAIGVNQFGLSAPGNEIMNEFGFVPDVIAQKTKNSL